MLMEDVVRQCMTLAKDVHTKNDDGDTALRRNESTRLTLHHNPSSYIAGHDEKSLKVLKPLSDCRQSLRERV